MKTYNNSKRLAIITTHPIQYYAPLFKLLTENKKIQVKVFYTWGEKSKGKLYDPGFDKLREWDIPVLDGYEYEFVKNISSKPGSHHFRGINNPGLIRMIIEWNANAVLVIGWNFISHLKVMFYFKGKIPVLFRGDSTLLDEVEGMSLKKIIRRLSLSAIYRYIDYALYVGTNNRAYFSANGVDKKKLIFAPHAIDNDRFNSNNFIYNQEAVNWKKELQIPSDKLTVLFAGKLEAKKNPLFLVEAAKKFPEIHFIIIGNGALEAVINDEIKAVKNITLLPFQNQSKMPVAYRLGDIFVLPSKGPGETWGLGINEAMASGRMIIASKKCGGAVDLVADGKNGYVINPDLESLTAILSIIQQPAFNIADFKRCSEERIKDFSLLKLSGVIENTLVRTVA